MKKKLIALAVILAMALTFGLVACGKETDLTEINGKLDAITSKIATLETTVGTINTKIAAVETKVNGAATTAELASLATELEAVKTALTALQTDVTGLKTASATAASVTALTNLVNELQVKVGEIQFGSLATYIGQNAFAAELTYGTGNHCGLAFAVVDNATKSIKFDEALIPNEWAKLSSADAAKFATGYTVINGGYPRFIQISNIAGLNGLYEGKQVSVNTTTGAYTAATSGPVRYFEVKSIETDADGAITVKYPDNASGEQTTVNLTKSLELKLNTLAVAQAYVTKLQTANYSNAAATVTVDFVKYVGEFNASQTATAAPTVKTDISVKRLKLEKVGGTGDDKDNLKVTAADLDATSVALGAAASSIVVTAATSGTYATTFFKLGSPYTGNFKFDGASSAAGTTTNYATMQDKLLPIVKTAIVCGWTVTGQTTSGVNRGLIITAHANVATGASAANAYQYFKVLYNALVASHTA